MRLLRYWLSNRQPMDDLEKSILGFTEAILSLPLLWYSPLPLSWYSPPLFPNINSAFHGLTFAIFLHVLKSMHPKDIKSSIIYFRYLRRLPPDIHNHLSIPITLLLVHALRL